MAKKIFTILPKFLFVCPNLCLIKLSGYLGFSSASISSSFSMIVIISVDCDITVDLLFVTLVDRGVGRRTENRLSLLA